MWRQALTIIYPERCVFCREILLTPTLTDICPLCERQLRLEIPLRTRLAGKDLSFLSSQEESILFQEEEVPKEMRVFPLLPYTGVYRKAILRWKYRGIRKYAKTFAALWKIKESEIKALGIQALIPVPLAPSRQQRRGFNQAQDLARELGKALDLPVLNCLERIRDTKPQANCDLKERQRNIKGSIVCHLKREDISFPLNTIGIIDDIYTTGSTARACYQAIQEALAFSKIKVYVLVVARGEI